MRKSQLLPLLFSPVLASAVQVPLNGQLPPPKHNMALMNWKSNDFEFKSGEDVFTPKDLVELPRPGGGVANDVGDLVLVSMSKYSFKDKKNGKSIWISPLESAVSSLEIPFANGGDVFWLDTYTIGHVVANSDKSKGADLFAINVKYTAEGITANAPESPLHVGSFPPGVEPHNFRYSKAAGRLVFSAYVFSDGDLFTVEQQNKDYENRGNTALVYDETYERHWDTWTGPKRSALFTVSLVKEKLGDDYSSPLKDTKHDVPVEPFGGLEDFDISDSHIVYTTKDPKLPPAWHTRQNVYIVDFLGQTQPRELTSGKQGATRNPVFSHNAKKVAWLELDEDGYESDRAKVVIYDLEKNVRFTLTQDWDRSPDSLTFSLDDTALFLTVGDEAHVKVYTLALPPTPNESSTHPKFSTEYNAEPTPLTHSHAASSILPLPNGRLIYTQSSFTSPNDVFIIRGLAEPSSILSSTQTKDAALAKLEYAQVTRFTADSLKGKDLDSGESFVFEGAEGKQIQGWVLKPKGWKEGVEKQFPVLLLIHGGPQGAWEDQWSTRWNPNVFAQQGYFTVAINPTGSTTFGQNLTDAIAQNWGGTPFVDMQKGWKYILEQYPEIDSDRAVAAGASWGGYAINWIQGHPEFGFGFKALVCHDGVFDSAYNGFSTDELFFFNHEFGGRPWDGRGKELTEKFSPSNFVHKWSTPQLIIHGSKDYRLPDTEGIGAFHALQQLGIPSRLVVFPDENHWVLNHGNSLKWHYEVLRWFDKFVGDKESKA